MFILLHHVQINLIKFLNTCVMYGPKWPPYKNVVSSNVDQQETTMLTMQCEQCERFFPPSQTTG